MTELEKAAISIKRLVERHDDFVNKHIGSIKQKTLDTHFLIRSVESGFSYWWGSDKEIEEQIYQDGFVGLAKLMKRKYPSFRGFDREVAGDISFWAILSYFDLVDPASIASALMECPASCSPLTMKSNTWKLEWFLAELAKGKKREGVKRLLSAFEKVKDLNCHLPRYRNRFYYGILKNSCLLNEVYEGSFEYFLKAHLNTANPGRVLGEGLGRLCLKNWTA